MGRFSIWISAFARFCVNDSPPLAPLPFDVVMRCFPLRRSQAILPSKSEAFPAFSLHLSLDNSSDAAAHSIDAAGLGLFGVNISGEGTVYLQTNPGGHDLDSQRVDVETPTPPHASNLRWTIGQTLISYSWTAPSGYSRFRVTFDGDSYDIRRTSYTASNLIPGLSYRFSVQTKSADGTELSGRLSVTLETDCADGDDCRSTRSLASSFGDGIYLVGSEVEAGNYMIGTQPEDKICEWGRLANLDGSDGQEIEVGGYEADKTVTIESTDHAFFTFNCGTWEQQE